MLVSEFGRILAGTIVAAGACLLISCGERNAIDQRSAETDAPGNAGEVRSADAPGDAGMSGSPESAAVDARLAAGREFYNTHCLLCHQYDGSGVPNFQPALVDSAVVAGDADHLIRMVLYGVGSGPNAVPRSGAYSGVMNGFGYLPDEDLAALISFVRAEWGAGAGGVSASDIARVRASSAE